MLIRVFAFSLITLVIGVGEVAAGVTMTFEGFAPPGGLVNINPGGPYTESGFELTPSDSNSAVFDAAYPNASFPGDPTSWFGFAADNTITLTNLAATPFTLNSLLLGPSTIGTPPVDITLVGNISGGGTVTETFTGLTTATLESPNWTNLTSVVINATTDSGLDNIALNFSTVPEPSSIVTAALGLFFGTIGVCRHRRNHSAA